VTETLFQAAQKSLGSSDYTGAEQAADTALKQSIQAFGKDDICTTPFIDEAAVVAASAGDLSKARDLYLRAIQIVEGTSSKPLDSNRRFLSELFHNLSAVYQRDYDQAQANKYKEQEKAINAALGVDYDRLQAWMQIPGMESYLGPATGAHLLEQYALQSVGSSYISQFYLWHALNIVKANGDSADPLFWLLSANYANTLSDVFRLEGDKIGFERAVILQQEALAEAEKNANNGDALAAESYVVAGAQLEVGEYAKAEELFRQSLRLAPFQEGSTDSSALLSQIGLAQSEIGLNHLAAAKADLQLVPKYEPSTLGNPKPDYTAEFYALIGYLEGNFELANQKLLTLLAEEGPHESRRSRTLRFLADVSRREGKQHEAVNFLRQSIDVLEESAQDPESALEVGITPQTEELAVRLDQAICLALDSKDDADASQFAVESALRIKGRQLVAAVKYASSLHSIPIAAEVKLQRLRDVQSSLSMLLWDCALNPLISPDWIEIQRLVDEQDQLKSDFHNWSVFDAAPPTNPPTSFKQIQGALSPESAFLEITIYRRFDLVKSELEVEPLGDPHYAAVLIKSQGPPRWYDIGSVSSVDSQLAEFRKLISTTRAAGNAPPNGQSTEELVPVYSEGEIRRAGKILYNEIFLEGLGSIRRLVVSPDGELNSLPFAALVGADGKYLRDRLSVSYLSLPSDLTESNAGDVQPSSAKVVVFADPAFDWKLPDANNAITSSEMPQSPTRRSVQTSGANGIASRTVFTQLPGTEQEASNLKRLFPEADLYVQKAATKAALLAVHEPMVLHVATHAGFIESPAAPPSSSREVGPVAFDNPMIRANVILAGANASLRARNEASVSALELSTIELQGTELVVVSGCETALGTTSPGEGVYGLRRGIAIAGAKRSVLSLWKIDDAATAELMKRFYEFATKENTIGNSLSQAQKELEKSSAEWEHPYYWAGFVLSGKDSAIPGLSKSQATQTISRVAQAADSKPALVQNSCHSKWIFKGQAGAPTVGGNLVVVATREGTVYAIDSETGQEKWRFSTGSAIPKPATIANDTVYFGNFAGKVYAIELNSGRQRWDFAAKDEVAMQLVVIDDVVYAGTILGDLHALDAHTGRELWKFRVNTSDSDSTVHIVYWVTIHENSLYLGDSDGHLYCLSPETGRQLWELKFPRALPAPPSFANGSAFLGSHDHFVYAVRSDTHQIEWKYELGDEVDWKPIVVGSLLLAVPEGVSSEQLTALDLRSGQLKWRYQLNDPVTTALVEKGNRIFFGGQKGLYVFDLNQGETHLLDSSNFVTGTPAVSSDAIYYSDSDRQLHALACQ
jgi:CHAT domain-containing protein/outer membrane protein assembly factor BamB/tetratricopeptide (TPR) repeat protein